MKYTFLKHILLLIVSFSANSVLAQHSGNRILVIGGGGARGAWAGGFAYHLTLQNGGYKRVYGTSTGSLLAPLVLLQKFDQLKQAYTSVQQRDIFNKNPFKKKGKHAGDLKGLYAGWRFLSGKKSFGTTYKLRNLMNQFLDDSEYNRIKSSNLSYTVAVANFKSGKVGYASSDDIKNSSDMKDWMWASANEPLFMNYVTINDTPFADGGVMQNIPLIEAVKYAQDPTHDVDEIDVIINKPEDALAGTEFTNYKIIKGLQRLIELWSVEIRNDNILIGELMAASNKYISNMRDGSTPTHANNTFKINLYYLPERMFVGANAINQKELLFDKGRMTELWTVGESGEYDHPKNVHEFILPKQPEAFSELGNIIEENSTIEFKMDETKAPFDKKRQTLHKKDK